MYVRRRRGPLWVSLLVMVVAAGLLAPASGARTAETARDPAISPAPDGSTGDDHSSADINQGPEAYQPPFTAASISGAFAWTNIGQGGGQFPVADLGVLAFDGTGRFSGSVTINLPGEDFTKRIPDFRSSFSGSYTVMPDGAGTTTARFVLPGGATRETTSHFVITEAVVRSGQRIAREIRLVADELSSISGNLDVAILKQIPSGGFSAASLNGTYGFHTIGHGGAQPTADAGLTTFDGRGKATVRFNQNIPGGENMPQSPAPAFSQRQVFRGSVNQTYQVDADGTGKSDVAHFVITRAQRTDNQLVATEVFVIGDELDPYTGNLQTTTLTRLSASPNPQRGGFTAASLKGLYGGKVIGRGGQTQQLTVSIFRFDGAGNFSGPGVVNLPGQEYGQRTFIRAPFVGTYTVQPNGLGTTRDGGDSYFAITKSKLINGVNVATEIALVVRELQPSGNLITVMFTRLPDQGGFSAASLRGTYGWNAIGYGGQMPEAGVGTVTFNGAGASSLDVFQNIPSSTAFDRQVFERSNVVGSYTVDAYGIGQTFFPSPTDGTAESVLVVTRASVRNNVKIADEFFLIVKDYSPLSRSILTSIATRIGD